MNGKHNPTKKLQPQLTMQLSDIAVATYLLSNISATMSHGIGPKPISKNDTNAITATNATILYVTPVSMEVINIYHEAQEECEHEQGRGNPIR